MSQISPEEYNPNLGLVENKGQFKDDQGNVLPSVFLRARLSAADVYFHEGGMIYLFKKGKTAEEYNAKVQRHTKKLENYFSIDHEPKPVNRKVEWSGFKLELIGADIDKSRLELTDAIDQGVEHFYYPHANTGIRDVKQFRTAIFRDVYPGIDWKIVSNSQGLKYDFIVSPGADYKQIKIKYKGDGEVSLGPEELSLRFTSKFGEIKEGDIYTYYKESNGHIPSKYKIEDDVISFELEGASNSETVIIDPPLSLIWSSYYGGSEVDGPRDMVVDGTGNVFIVGYTASADLPVQMLTGAFYEGVFQQETDFFILKFDKDGKRSWATYYGGLGDDRPECVKLDGAGNLYVVGFATSDDFPLQTVSGAYNQNTKGGTRDVFIVKFDGQGQRLWATLFGGDGYDNPLGINIGKNDELYIVGETKSTNLPVTTPGGGAYYQNTFSGNNRSDGFVSEFDKNGALKWSTYIGKLETDFVSDVAADNNGNVYILGTSNSVNMDVTPLGGGAYYQPNIAPDTLPFLYGDAFIFKFDAQKILKWGTYLGGKGPEVGSSLVVDQYDNVFVTGSTSSDNYPLATPGSPAYYQPTRSGTKGDGFISKFGSDGKMLWSTFYGGSDSDYPYDLHVDNFDNVYLTGTVLSTDLPTKNPGGAYVQGTHGGNQDVFIVQFDDKHELTWSTYYGASGFQWGEAVGTDNNGCVYATGEWWEPVSDNVNTKDPQNGAWFQPNNAGRDDGFILKFCPSGCISPVVKISGDTAFCEGDSVVLTASGATTYSWSPSAGLNTTNGPTVVAGPGTTTTYTLTGEVNGGCSSNKEITINVVKKREVTIEGGGTICVGDTIQLAAQASGSNNEFIWSTGDTADVLTVTTPDKYWVTLQTGACLSGDTADVVGSKSPMRIELNKTNDTDCDRFGSVSATAWVSVTGGQEPYTYLWSNGQISDSIFALSPGKYHVTVTDFFGCETTDTVLIQNIVDISTSILDITCGTCTDGSATVQVNGGTPPYTYRWNDDNQQTTANATGLGAGKYVVIVTDSNGCFSSDTIHLGVIGIDDLHVMDKRITIFPNPVNGAFTISYINDAIRDWNYQLFDVRGAMIYSREVNNSESSRTDLRALPRGIYMLIISSKEGRVGRRIQVMH